MSKARFLQADRDQPRWDVVDLESQLATDHRARIVWSFVDGLDLSSFYDRIGSREDVAGRPPADPKILLSVWLFATLENIGSARAVDRACERDIAFRWLCGGVGMNYHTLSDFRSMSGVYLDTVLTKSVSALMSEKLVSLEEIVQDGTKVRADAGRGSFVGEKGLAAYEKAARARVHRLREELETDAGASNRRGRAARARAASQVSERAAKARETYNKLVEEKQEAEKTHKKAEAEKSERTVSTTDPESRLMRFADNSMAGAYNIQLAAAGCFVVGLEVTDRRNDMGLAEPMVKQLDARYERRPSRLVLDSKIATQEEIISLSEPDNGAVEIYAPLPEERDDITPESLRKRIWRQRTEPDALKAWRARMQTPEADVVMKRRGLIETINAILKNRGMRHMSVRGMEKVRSVVLLQALANNLMQADRLRQPT
jgi:transposase